MANMCPRVERETMPPICFEFHMEKKSASFIDNGQLFIE
jgi:hypothetical protein